MKQFWSIHCGIFFQVEGKTIQSISGRFCTDPEAVGINQIRQLGLNPAGGIWLAITSPAAVGSGGEILYHHATLLNVS